MPGYILQSRWDGTAKDSIGCPMDEHQGLETLQMVYRIGDPKIALKLWHLEIHRERLSHYLVTKRLVSVVPIVKSWCLVMDHLDPLTHLTKIIVDVSSSMIFRIL